MGLQDRYKALASGGSPAPGTASAAPSTPPTVTSTPAASAPAVSSSRAAATAATTTPSPASPTPATPGPGPARRDLTALRQKLAGGNGGCNPPEAVAAVKDDMLDPTTKETPDGGAEPLPNHPDFGKKGEVSTDAPAAAEAPSEGAPAKRKRRTKAEMEAARAAEAAATAAPAPTASTNASTAAPESPVALAHGIGTPEYHRELAAATAETEGHVILTDELRRDIGNDAVEAYLAHLDLEAAITLVQERMPRGVKTLEVER